MDVAAMKANDFLALIQRATRKASDPIPEGFKTSEQWAEEWGWQRGRAKRNLDKGIAAGVVEMRKFRIASGNNLRHVGFYRPAKSPPKR